MKFFTPARTRLLIFILVFWTTHRDAAAETNISLTTSIEQESHSSLLSLETNKTYSKFQLGADLSSEYAAPYVSPKSFTDAENLSISITATTPLKPMLGVSAVNSIREKTTTWGLKSGLSVPIVQSSSTLTWSPNISAKRTAIRVAHSSNKLDKKLTNSIIQFGTSQTLSYSREKSFTLGLFYQRYFYNNDIEALTRKLTLASRVLQRNRNLQAVFETVSVFSRSLAGASFSSELSDQFELKADFYRTRYERDDSYSDVFVPRFTASLTENLDAYLQADLIVTEPSSQSFTMAFPCSWTESWSSEFGVSQSRSGEEKSWSLVLALSYGLDATEDELKVGSQSQ